MSNTHECLQMKNARESRSHLPTYNRADVDFIEKYSGKWYLVVNGEYSTPVTNCPFCGKQL